MKLSPSLFSRLNPGKPPWRVLFFGTDKFAVHPLQNLLERMQDGSLIENVELVCPPERRRAINKKVQNENFITAREYAIEEGIPIHEWKGKEGWAPEYSPGGPYDIGVVASFGYLIPNNVIDLCPSGMVNIHPSILPKWRGAAPMTHAILSGASHTGVSIVGVSRDRFDHGKILLQENYKIRDDIMYDDLSDELAILGSRMMLYTIEHWDELWKTAKVQPKEGASKDDVEEIREALPGQTKYDKEREILFIKCKDDWAGFTELQFECKDIIKARDFANSYLLQSIKNSKDGRTFKDLEAASC